MGDFDSTALPAVVIVTGLICWFAIVSIGIAWVTARTTATTTDDEVAARRVIRNAGVPIISQLLTRGIDLAVAIALLRLLGPEGNGQYAIAVVAWLYVKTISDFGLSVLAAREIARDVSIAGRVIGETTLLRWIVLATTAAPLAVAVALGVAGGTLSSTSAVAIGLLYLSIVPSSYAEAVSSAFAGLERMALAAWLNIGVSVVRAPIVVALAATQLEVTGVALAALLAAAYSAVVFRRAARQSISKKTTWSLGASRLRWYLHESWPLMLNALLISLLFRVDVFIVQAARGDEALGVYDASYKLINMLTIVPAYAVLAVFPLLVRRSGDVSALRQAQRKTTYILVVIAWTAVVATTALAYPAIRILAGDEYLPEAAILLRVLIWFAPLSFVNGVTQYVLIARGEQRRLAPAFVAAVVFNLVANVALVPVYGARAAALNTVVTECVIALSFWFVTRGSAFPAVTSEVFRPLWRPSVAGMTATVIALALHERPLAAVVLSIACFVALGWLLRVVGPEETHLLRSVLHRRSRNGIEATDPAGSTLP